MDIRNLPKFLWLGRVGENQPRSFSFDVSPWLSDHEGASAALVWERPDGALYSPLVNVTTSPLVWTPDDTALAVSGKGRIEIRISGTDTVIKSAVMVGEVSPSLTGEEATPEAPVPDWVQTVNEKAAQVENDAAEISALLEGMTEEGQLVIEDAYAAAQTGGYSDTKAAFYADLAAVEGLADWFADL